MRLGIIGAGKVGGSLILYLKEKNVNFCWWTRDKNKQDCLKELIEYSLPLPEEVFENSELTFICIKDDEIENFVKSMDLKNKGKVVHMSGTLGLEILEPLKEKGFKTGSFHPIQTFAKMSSDYFKNIYASFLGDSEIYEALKHIFEKDVKILKVDGDQKFLIHLSSTISSNFLVFLLRWCENILKKGNLELDILFPLVKNTFNNIREKGPYRALTGPARRKDFNILVRHEKYILENSPELLKIYLEITRNLLKNELL